MVPWCRGAANVDHFAVRQGEGVAERELAARMAAVPSLGEISPVAFSSGREPSLSEMKPPDGLVLGLPDVFSK